MADLDAALAACALTVTIVRLPDPGRACPLRRVLTTVAREDLALADALHVPNVCRPYAVVRRAAALDVVCFRDDLARALLRGEREARLVTRIPLREHLARPTPGAQLALVFTAPLSFRANGLDDMSIDAGLLFASLRLRWASLGLPPLPLVRDGRIAAWVPRGLRTAGLPGKDGHALCGLVGEVRYQYGRAVAEPTDRTVLGVLARFGELRGTGHGTSYGMGRMRVLAPGEHWFWGDDRSCWESARQTV